MSKINIRSKFEFVDRDRATPHKHPNYIAVFVGLAVLTAVELGVAFLPWARLTVILTLVFLTSSATGNPITFDHVYATFSDMPFENRRVNVACSESYILVPNGSTAVVAAFRPNRARSGWPAVPAPITWPALRLIQPMAAVERVATYPACAIKPPASCF